MFFFIISGFIMWSMTDAATRPLSFLLNRLIRIVPLYWAATLLMGLHQHAAPLAIAKSLFFIPYFGEDDQIWPVLAPGWTLNYEIFFYLIFSVVLLVPQRQRFVAALVTLSLLAVAHPLVAPSDPILTTYTNPLMLEFVAGIVLAELRNHAALPDWKVALPAGLLGVVALFLIPVNETHNAWRGVSWGIPAFMIVASFVAFEAHQPVRRLMPLMLVGNASFSIYLFHPFIIRTVTENLPDTSIWLRVIAVLLSACAVGITIFFFIERPVTAWLRSRLQFKKVRASQAGGHIVRRLPGHQRPGLRSSW